MGALDYRLSLPFCLSHKSHDNRFAPTTTYLHVEKKIIKKVIFMLRFRGVARETQKALRTKKRGMSRDERGYEERA